MRHFHAKTTSAKLHIYIGVGSRDLIIDKAHTALGIFPVSFPCMLPTPLCGIFRCFIVYSFKIHSWMSRNKLHRHHQPQQQQLRDRQNDLQLLDCDLNVLSRLVKFPFDLYNP